MSAPRPCHPASRRVGETASSKEGRTELLRLLACCAAVGLSACASAPMLPDADRVRLTREYEGQVLFLRASVFVMPFFNDPTRRLISQLPPDSIELIQDPEGKTILPGAPEGMLTLGTRVRIEQVEFPTSLVVTRRPLYSPREQPWVYLSVPGAPRRAPYVAVLPPGLRTREQLVAAWDRLFSPDDPSVWLEKFPAEQRTAIVEKRLVEGMEAAAVELAWGRPERIRQEVDRGIRTETWIWPLGKRSATFREGKLEAATPPLAGAAGSRPE